LLERQALCFLTVADASETTPLVSKKRAGFFVMDAARRHRARVLPPRPGLLPSVRSFIDLLAGEYGRAAEQAGVRGARVLKPVREAMHEFSEL
jgi:hypothetical protein